MKASKATRAVVRTTDLRYWMIALVLATGVAMSPVITNDFISLDDENFILINPVVQEHDLAGAFRKQLYSPHYKPLVYSGWIVEHAIFGNDPFIYHFVNWLLHILNTVLVFFCIRRIAEFWDTTRRHSIPAGFFTALLFGVHPLHVESVAWAIERKDVLFTFFYLLGLLSYLRYLDKKEFKFMLFTGLFYILSLLSKSMGISLLPVLFVIDIAAGRRDWVKMAVEKWPVYLGFILALIMYGVVYKPPHKSGGTAAGEIVEEFTEGAVLAPPALESTPGLYQTMVVANFRYLFFMYHTLLPVKLAIVYTRQYLLNWPGAFLHAMFLITLGIWSLPVLIKRYRLPVFAGLAFFSIAISPVLLDDGIGSNFASDRYTYVPSIGLLLLVSILFLKLFPGKVRGSLTHGGLALAVIAGIFAISAFRQSLKWGDDIALFTQAIDNYPDNGVAYGYRAGAYKDIDPAKALVDFNKCIEIDPIRPGPYYSRGTLLLNLKRYQEAIPDFDFVIAKEPKKWEAYVNRGNCYRDLGYNEQALNDYNHVLEKVHWFHKARNNRGVVYLNQGDLDKALQDFTWVSDLEPSYYNAYINKAAVYINPRMREYDKAIEEYNNALKYDPDNTQALYFRGYCLYQLRRYAEAVESITQAIDLNNTNGNYYYMRARALREMGRIEESVRDARKAAGLGADVASEYLN